MPTRHAIRLRFAWLALCAVLLGAFAPSVSYAMSASRPALPVDVCSTHGGASFAATVALLSQDQDERGAHGSAVHHCGWCLVHSHGVADLAAPPPSFRIHLPTVGHERPPAAVAPSPSFAFVPHAQPRGPPTFA